MMHAHSALVMLAVLMPALVATADRLGYEREIQATQFNQVPKLVDFILTDQAISSQKNRAKLVTKLRPEDEVAADNVILESNVVRLVSPRMRFSDNSELVRRRRGYNLENVRVPARYPYLPVAQFNRFPRWG